MNEIHTAIDVDAPASVVWAVLTDFAAYPDWNPYTRIEGTASVGERLRVSPGPEAGSSPTFRPRVLVADADRELVWKGRLYAPGIFDGVHAFTLEPLGEDRTRLVQHERFGGLLVGPILRRYGADTERNFEGVNAALKARAEALAAEQGVTGDATAA